MAGFQVPNLAYLRNIPVIGGRLYEALHGAQKAINTIALQGNLNPDGQVDPPPSIDGVTATASNGVLHVSIQHTAADVRRDVVYHVEHADNPNFINPQIRHIGDTRSFSEFIGNQQRYVQAYASYGASAAGPVLVHGGASTPQPVSGGGDVGPAPYLPSQGRSTGAPGQGGAASSPVPIRSEDSGFDWRLQRPIASEAESRAMSPGSQNGIGSGNSGGGGGGGGITLTESLIAAAETLITIAGTGNAITGVTNPSYSALAADFAIRYVPIHDNSGPTTLAVNGIAAKAVTKNGTGPMVGGELVTGRAYLLIYDGAQFQLIGQIAPISATVLASDAHGIASVATLADTQFWIGNGATPSLPVAHAMSGDASMDHSGVVTVTGANGAAIPASQSFIGTNASGQFVPGGSPSFASFTPTLTFGGLAVAMTGTFTGKYLKLGSMVCVSITITLTNKGTSVGAAVIAGLPFTVNISGTGALDSANMLLMTAPYALASSATSAIALNQTGATGGAAMTDGNFTNTSVITLSLFYGT